MRVKVVFDVKSMDEVRTVLAVGRDYSLYDCKVESFEVLKPTPHDQPKKGE